MIPAAPLHLLNCTFGLYHGYIVFINKNKMLTQILRESNNIVLFGVADVSTDIQI